MRASRPAAAMRAYRAISLDSRLVVSHTPVPGYRVTACPAMRVNRVLQLRAWQDCRPDKDIGIIAKEHSRNSNGVPCDSH